jgi:hypothetical protein
MRMRVSPRLSSLVAAFLKVRTERCFVERLERAALAVRSALAVRAVPVALAAP